jgi:hypothetical protein
LLKLSAISAKENEENNECEDLPGSMHCPSSFDSFLSVEQSIQSTYNQKTSSDGFSCDHNASDEEGKKR